MCLFILSTADMFLVMAASSDSSPFSTLGAGREMIQIMAYEPMTLLLAWASTWRPARFHGGGYHQPAGQRCGDHARLFAGDDVHHGHQAAQVALRPVHQPPRPPGDRQGPDHRDGRPGPGGHEHRRILRDDPDLGLVALFFLNSNPISWPVAIAACLLVYFLEILWDNVSARVKWKALLDSCWVFTLLTGGLNGLILMLIDKGGEHMTNKLAKSPWLLHYDGSSCNGCDIEVLACTTPKYDIERFGIINTGDPFQADILLITGGVNHQSESVIHQIYTQMPEPKVVVAVGICACTGRVQGLLQHQGRRGYHHPGGRLCARVRCPPPGHHRRRGTGAGDPAAQAGGLCRPTPQRPRIKRRTTGMEACNTIEPMEMAGFVPRCCGSRWTAGGSYRSAPPACRKAMS